MLSWHTQQWQMLWDVAQKKRLPHALLFLGHCELEKKHFVQSLATTLLCVKPIAGKSCEHCHACHLISAGSHPDLCWVEPEEAGQIIKIDQIREVVTKVNETAMQGGLRIVILNPAHAMNMAASNALLKTLEEPAPNTLIVLITDQVRRLPATIASRCQKIMFHKPKNNEALAWLNVQQVKDSELLLKIAEGFPLKAAALTANDFMMVRQKLYQGLGELAKTLDPLAFAAQFQECNTTMLLTLLQSWLRDLLRIQIIGETEIINSDYQKMIIEIAKTISLENSVKYLDLVQSLYGKIINRFNLNKQLLLEDLMIHWKRYVSC